MRGRVPWVMLLVLLGAATAQGEAVIAVSASQPPVEQVAPPAAAETRDGEDAPRTTTFLRLPSVQTIQAVVNGRRLVPAAR